METLNISVKKRDTVGSRASKALRMEGYVPAVMYGHGGESVALAMPLKSVEKCLKNTIRIMKIDLEGETQQALMKDLQWDTYGQEILHVDLMRVRMDEVISMSIALQSKGRAKGIEEGGVLELSQNSVTVKCLPTRIPEFIEYDVSDLGIGDSLFYKDLVFPEGVELDDNPDNVVVSITTRVEEVEEEPEEEGEEGAEGGDVKAEGEEDAEDKDDDGADS